MIGLLGKKLGHTRVYDAQGVVVPVTVVQAGPNRVLQCKTPEKDGYQAVQLGFDEQKESRLNTAQGAHQETQRRAGETHTRVSRFFASGQTR